jgi:hypothetical protein
MRHRPREIPREIEIPDADAPAVRARETDEHPYRRRLSGAVGAEEAEDLSRADIERDVGDDLTLAEAPREPFRFEDDFAWSRCVR